MAGVKGGAIDVVGGGSDVPWRSCGGGASASGEGNSDTFRNYYEVESVLSRALCGRILKARQKAVEEKIAVAVKEITSGSRHRMGLVKEDVDMEIEVMRKLRKETPSSSPTEYASVHPNLLASIPISDQISEGSHRYIVMPLADGDMYRLIDDRNGGLDEDTARLYFSGIVSGLTHLHEEMGLTHRDLSLENIFMLPDALSPTGKRPVIADFGLALYMGDDLHRTSHKRVGKLGYMSPETYNASKTGGCPDDGNADIWSLGVILITMLTGVPPYVRPDASMNSKLRDRRYVEIASGRLRQMFEGWGHTYVSDFAYDLVQRLLTADLEKRITINEIIHHPWMRPKQEADLLHDLGRPSSIRGVSADDFINKPDPRPMRLSPSDESSSESSASVSSTEENDCLF